MSFHREMKYVTTPSKYIGAAGLLCGGKEFVRGCGLGRRARKWHFLFEQDNRCKLGFSLNGPAREHNELQSNYKNHGKSPYHRLLF